VTQLEEARAGRITDEVARASRGEPVSPEEISALVAAGHAVVPANVGRPATRGVTAIGRGLKIKVNANIGTSGDVCDVTEELEKLRVAAEAGADAVMDLSTGGDLTAVREQLLDASPVTFGTVPIYTAAVRAAARGGIKKMTADDIVGSLRADAEAGVDFATVHAGVTRKVVEIAKEAKRVCGIVSRGGAFLSHWMLYHEQENPFYERYDEVLEIARQYEVVLSLGDGLRPGAIADSFDDAQVGELTVVAQIRLAKSVTRGAPLYVLGPVVIDVAPGYDHIVGAVGGAIAAEAGADFLCYLTPAEHLRLPDVEDVRVGVIATRIAAHAADVARGIPGAAEWDREVSELRHARKWDQLCEKVMDPRAAREGRASAEPSEADTCSMCGEFCAFKILDDTSV